MRGGRKQRGEKKKRDVNQTSDDEPCLFTPLFPPNDHVFKRKREKFSIGARRTDLRKETSNVRRTELMQPSSSGLFVIWAYFPPVYAKRVKRRCRVSVGCMVVREKGWEVEGGGREGERGRKGEGRKVGTHKRLFLLL